MKVVTVQFEGWESEVPVMDEVYYAIYAEGFRDGQQVAESIKESQRNTEDDLK